MDIAQTWSWTITILGVGLLIKSFETIATVREYGSSRIFDFKITGNDAFQTSRLNRLFEHIYSSGGMLVLCLLTVFAVPALVVFSFDEAWYIGALSVMIVANLAIYYRQAFGLDGADQMGNLILLTALLCVVFTNDPRLRELGLFFIAIQLSLSYAVSGIAKLFSSDWRRGTAIVGILSTYTYGTRLTRKFLSRRSGLSLVMCWAVILIEVAFPFALFFDGTVVVVAMGLVFAMHVSIAVVMGLNDFVWAFAAAYPAFWYLAQVIQQVTPL